VGHAGRDPVLGRRPETSGIHPRLPAHAATGSPRIHFEPHESARAYADHGSGTASRVQLAHQHRLTGGTTNFPGPVLRRAPAPPASSHGPPPQFKAHPDVSDGGVLAHRPHISG